MSGKHHKRKTLIQGCNLGIENVTMSHSICEYDIWPVHDRTFNDRLIFSSLSELAYIIRGNENIDVFHTILLEKYTNLKTSHAIGPHNEIYQADLFMLSLPAGQLRSSLAIYLGLVIYGPHEASCLVEVCNKPLVMPLPTNQAKSLMLLYYGMSVTGWSATHIWIRRFVHIIV